LRNGQKFLLTNRAFPNLYAQKFIGALEFASVRDFGVCGLLVRQNGAYIFKTHRWLVESWRRAID